MIFSIIKGFIIFTILFLIYLIGYFFFFQPKGFSVIEVNSIIIKNISLALSTLLGIFSRNIYSEIKRRKSKSVKITYVVKKVINSKSLWLSIFVSPIVLITIFNGAAQIPDNLIAFLFAYQNGFFFDSIIDLSLDNEIKDNND